MSKKHTNIEKIGSDLVSAAKDQSQDSLPLSTRLFPYIYIASRRMSLRTITGWLESNHGVSLSAASISKALNNPQLHLERLAHTIAPVARYVSISYGCNPQGLLFRADPENGPSDLHTLANHDHASPQGEQDIPRWEELQYLASLWEPMPHEVQLLLQPFLRELLTAEEPEPSLDDQF